MSEFEGAARIPAGPNGAQDGIAVWARGRLAGVITTRRTGFDATTTSGVALGRYNSVSAAARALLDLIGAGDG